MEQIKPVGQKLIVLPLDTEETEAGGGIIVRDINLQRGKIVEVSDELEGVYEVGDIVIFPKSTGISCPNYQGKSCLWITSNIDVWGIVKEQSTKKND